MSETTYNLYTLCQGSRACDASWLLYLSESGRTRTLPYFFWVLMPEGEGAPVVIDTGNAQIRPFEWTCSGKPLAV